MLQRHVFLFIFNIQKHGVPLVEGATARILPAEADRHSRLNQAAESQRFSHAIVHGALACPHLGALFEQLFHLRVDVEVFGVGGELLCNLAQLFCRQTGLHFIVRLVASTFIVVPIFGKIAKSRLLDNGSRVFLCAFIFSADRCDFGLRVLRTNVLRIDFPQCRMIFDRLIHQWLGNSGIV